MIDKNFGTDNNGSGFHIKFKNGWVVSVQFGKGTYCENYHTDLEYGLPAECDTAEIWAFNDNGTYPENPLGYQSPELVLEFMNKVSKF
jgi:hypothetical protein